jgi:NAD(P)-dependent dehydrogenase (short-subunit alcohol dehydrogenase family)
MLKNDRGNSIFSLAGRCAFITGSTQGVGAAIAIALANAGADVCLHGLAIDEDASRVREQCLAAGVKVDWVIQDLVTDDHSMLERLVSQVEERFPNVDLLVNNAGTYIDLPFLEMTRERYHRTMQLNVESAFFLTQAFARRWVERGKAGRVLFTGSINGLLAEPTHVAYDSSKGAIASMVRSMCVSLAPLGIRVNAIAPGLVRTPLTNQVLSSDPDSLAWMKLHTPSGIVPEADACGGAAVFLLSDAAEHIHGQTLLIDGGMSAWQQPDLPNSLRGHL